MFEDNTNYEPTFQFIHDIIITNLILKNENRILPKYIPRVRLALEKVLSRSPEIDLEPDEWETMIEIANRVKENLQMPACSIYRMGK